MKRTLIKLGKFSLALAGLLFLAASAFAQVSLREALDFDLDGKADYIIFRPSTNTWWVSKSSNGSYQTYQYTGFNISTKDYMTPGDYDGDNKADYSMWRNSDGYWLQYRSLTSTVYSAQFGTSGDEPVGRDYDGDNKTDFAVIRRTPGSGGGNGQMVWYVLPSSGGSFYGYQFGYDTDFPAPGDYDGDGKFDLAVQRPGATNYSSSTFYILRSSDSGLTTSTFGLSNDAIVPGDYDGDGKTDVAVVRDGVNSSQNIIWHLQRSTAGYTSVSLGLTGIDKPAQGDYDGDGKTDLAVWRESEGKFYVLRSTDGGLYGVSWGTFGDFPVASYDTH